MLEYPGSRHWDLSCAYWHRALYERDVYKCMETIVKATAETCALYQTNCEQTLTCITKRNKINSHTCFLQQLIILLLPLLHVTSTASTKCMFFCWMESHSSGRVQTSSYPGLCHRVALLILLFWWLLLLLLWLLILLPLLLLLLLLLLILLLLFSEVGDAVVAGASVLELFVLELTASLCVPCWDTTWNAILNSAIYLEAKIKRKMYHAMSYNIESIPSASNHKVYLHCLLTSRLQAYAATNATTISIITTITTLL